MLKGMVMTSMKFLYMWPDLEQFKLKGYVNKVLLA